MDGTKKGYRFYKTFDFWLGLYMIVANLPGVIQVSHFNITFLLDLIGLVLGISLIGYPFLKKKGR
ncbi:hypothetical protein ACFQ22_10030 [Lentilactobacillus raoultii]|uniref:Uncharacterized protein n=1 Tax=Lentilactobacillus raoultii TaxID=1987503 RepID=A0ABW3PQC0_9LACO|nr:hypothetical protein [Lentilactobacillus raoultii]